MASSNKLPCDTFTENTVLGLMLSDNKMATAILSNITLEDFYEENYQNQTVFRAIKRVSDRGDIIDITSVVSELVLMKELDNVSESYIYNLVEQTISTTNYEYYVNILKDYTLLRNFIKAVNEIKNEYETKDIKNINDFISKSGEKINEITRLLAQKA